MINRNIAILGGAGFIGKAIIEELLAADSLFPDCRIAVLDRASRPRWLPESVDYIQNDICNEKAVEEICRNTDIILHLAACIDWGNKPRPEILAVNTDAALRTAEICLDAGSKAFIYLSSEDAVCSGKPIRDGDENLPYPRRFPNAYCESKSLTEQQLQFIGGRGLPYAVIRPVGVWGPGDPYHMPPLLEMAKKGFFVRLGNGKARCMHVYVGNVAHQILLTAREILKRNTEVPGQIYFAVDSPPENFFVFFEKIISAAGYRIRPKKFYLPYWLMLPAGAFCELAVKILRPFWRWNPGLSRFAVNYTCRDFTIATDKAYRHFGYEPKYSYSDALIKTTAFFSKSGK